MTEQVEYLSSEAVEYLYTQYPSCSLKAEFGLHWKNAGEHKRRRAEASFTYYERVCLPRVLTDIMIDELGHRRHYANVPCFLGGGWHPAERFLGNDVRHCVLRAIYVCLYCYRERSKRPRE